jgi:hypothetical protein
VYGGHLVLGGICDIYRVDINIHFNSELSSLPTTEQMSGTVGLLVPDLYIYAIYNGHGFRGRK